MKGCKGARAMRALSFLIMPDAQAIIDSIENDLSRIRAMDVALKQSLLARLDELRAIFGGHDPKRAA
jgi:hypothetical protein